MPPGARCAQFQSLHRAGCGPQTPVTHGRTHNTHTHMHYSIHAQLSFRQEHRTSRNCSPIFCTSFSRSVRARTSSSVRQPARHSRSAVRGPTPTDRQINIRTAEIDADVQSNESTYQTTSGSAMCVPQMRIKSTTARRCGSCCINSARSSLPVRRISSI